MRDQDGQGQNDLSQGENVLKRSPKTKERLGGNREDERKDGFQVDCSTLKEVD